MTQRGLQIFLQKKFAEHQCIWQRKSYILLIHLYTQETHHLTRELVPFSDNLSRLENSSLTEANKILLPYNFIYVGSICILRAIKK